MYYFIERGYIDSNANDTNLYRLLVKHFGHPNFTKLLATLHYKDDLARTLNGCGFIPKTIIICKNSDFDKNGLDNESSDQLWFFKPAKKDKTEGIVIDTVKNLKRSYKKLDQPYVLQKMIKPYLINKKKFNIRCYMLISGHNKKFYLYDRGLIFFAHNDYNSGDTSRFSQIANRCLNSTKEGYKIENSSQIFSKEEFSDYDNFYP